MSSLLADAICQPPEFHPNRTGITSAEDFYGTTLFPRDQPSHAIPSGTGLVQTSYGLLAPNPIAGETVIPRNYGRGQAQVGFNLKIGKTWGFGPEKGSGGSGVASRDAKPSTGAGLGPPAGGRALFTQPSTPRRYNLTVAMSGRNILYHTNPGPIIGNITSPLFGRANQIEGTPNGDVLTLAGRASYTGRSKISNAVPCPSSLATERVVW